MIDVRKATLPIVVRGQRGTIFFISPTLALTAAHCIGSRETRTPYAEAFDLDGGLTVSLGGANFDLDVALLAVERGTAPDGLPIGPPSSLPGPDSVSWVSHGYPKAKPTGMHLSGTLTTLDGAVDGNPAIEMVCRQGGLGSLEGASGGPVCVSEVAVGLIRWSPPDLRQKVVLSTSVADILRVFPSLSTLASPRLQGAPTKASLRVLLTLVLPEEPDVEAFCLDNFDIKFAPRTTHIEMVTRLFRRAAPELVFAALKELHPDAVRANQAVLEFSTDD